MLRELHIAHRDVDTGHVDKKEGEGVWCSADQSEGGLRLVHLPATDEGRMPDVTGMGARDAVYVLQHAGLKVKIKGAGRVTTQSIKPGTIIKKGTTVNLLLSI